jgi:hypothetical protein
MILTVLAALAACQETHLLPPTNELVVVRAYLEAGNKLSMVHVASTLDLGSPDTLGPPVKDASVHIIRNEVCYELIHSGNGQYGNPTNPYTTDCPDCGLVFNPGDTIYLEIFHFGKLATSHTVIPPEPLNFSMSADPVAVPSSGDDQPEGDAFELSWDMDSDFWYYIEITHHENPRTPIGGGEPVYGYVPPIITEPFRDNRYIVEWEQLPYYGHYRVKVVAVNREYVELILTRNQDSRDLNEPISNVENGLGIFTAVNSTFLDFNVTGQTQ